MKPRVVLSLWAIAGALGCYAVEEPERTNVLAPVEREIQAALPDDASMVWEVAPHERPTAIRSITWSMRDGASLLVPYYLDSASDAPAGLPLAAYVDKSGAAIPLYTDEGEAVFSVSGKAPPPLVVSCGNQAVVRICGPESATTWVTDLAGGRIHRSEAALGDCERTVLGASLEGERFVALGIRADMPFLTEWSCEGGDIREVSEPKPLPWMPSLPVWVAEVEASVHAWVRHQPGSTSNDFGDWLYERSDGKDPVRIARTELPYPSGHDPTQSWERIRREPSGALLVDGVSGLYRWEVEGSGEVSRLAMTPSPSAAGFGAWEQTGFATAISSHSDWNPNGGQVEMPLAYEVLRSTGDGYESFAAPTTPCFTREDCRRIGESYLRGVVETEKGPLGLYVMWTWQFQPVPYGERTASGRDLAALILAPLDRPLP